MKVLMFGWEFPPFNSGGLGTACYGLTKGLANNDINVTFVVPHMPKQAQADYVKLISAGNLASIKLKSVKTNLVGYMTPEEYSESMILKRNIKGQKSMYGKNLFTEVYKYSQRAKLIAKHEDHDVIHAHDWMTYQAGIEAKKVSGKPLVIHVHATEFDRTGGNGVNQLVYDLEKKGMDESDAIIVVSNFTKEKIINHYGVNPDKITVVHNAVEFNDHNFNEEDFGMKDENKVVLFLGRITLQKGPDYFIDTAKKVLEIQSNTRFVIAGNGDMATSIINRAANLGIADKVLFTGFLKGKEIDKAYQMADLYLMPSVSEPFGITPLEAIRNGTPAIISKQSGVSEVLNHCIKVDFWDIEKMANKIVSLLRYTEAHESLKENGSREIKKFNWNNPAKQCVHVYNKLGVC
jgi:glycogen synthase